MTTWEVKLAASLAGSSLEIPAGGLKPPQGNINGDTTFTLRLQFVQHPGILEGLLVHFSCLLFKPLDNMLVNISKHVDQVTREGTYDVEIGLGKKNNFWVTPRYWVVQVKVFNVQ